MFKTLALRLGLVLLSLLSISSIVYAQGIEPDRERPIEHSRSITISPIHLALPEFFCSYEHKIQKKISVGAMAGIGELEGSGVYEIGAKWSYYLIGTFEHGMPISAELSYDHVSIAEDEVEENVSGTGSGVSIGPTLGYKYIADYGLTINLALGVQYMLITANAHNSETGERVSGHADAIGPLARILVGWSF